MIETLISTIQAHPVLTVVLALCFLRIFFAKATPYPEFPDSKVKSIQSLEALEKIKASLGGAYLIIDFYATWCPPCKRAAPVFNSWADEYPESDFVFAKVDVDKAKEVAQRFGINAMPTFKVLDKSGEEVRSFRGWRKWEIEHFLSEKTK